MLQKVKMFFYAENLGIKHANWIYITGSKLDITHTDKLM